MSRSPDQPFRLLLLFLIFFGMALLADFAVIGRFDAALVIAFLTGFHSGIATGGQGAAGADGQGHCREDQRFD